MKYSIRKLSGIVCAVAAFGLYLWTISPGAFPGASAKFIADYAGLSPALPMLHSIWWLLVQLVGAIPIGSLELRVNLLSALFGALAIWLIYEIVAGIDHDRTAEESHSSFRKSRVSAVSGLIAAGFLATSIPFWLVATRAGPIAFDLALALTVVWSLQRYSKSGAIVYFYIVSFGLGLGLTEFPTMLLVAPPVFLTLLYLMFRNGVFAKRHRHGRSPFVKWIARSVGLMLLGVLPALIFALMYRFSPAFEWRDFPSFFRLLIHIFRTYINDLTSGFNQLGWMLVSLVSLVPLVVVLLPKREQKKDHVLSSYFFHLVLSAVAIALVFNYHISPWSLFGGRQLVVTPYLLIAVWIGYLSGYWMVLATRRHRSGKDGTFVAILQKVFRIALPIVYVSLIVVAIFINFSECDGRSARPVQDLARDVVSNMSGRRWLISNGLLDDMIKIAASEEGLDIEVVNPRLAGSRPYLRYLSTKFDDPRLKGLAMLGLSPLLQEWFNLHPDEVESDVAILSNPDLWMASNYNVIPHKFVYFGSKDPVSAEDLTAPDDCRKPWSKFDFDQQQREAWSSMSAFWNSFALRHVGKIANNTGFFLQSSGSDEAALDAYKQALEIDPDNVSAMLNIASLSERMEMPDTEEWYKLLKDYVDKTGRKLSSWNLSYMYGYVYAPMAYVNRGLVWAMSGKPNLGVAEIKRALALGGKGEHLKVLLAGMYFMQREGDKSEEVFLDILKENPDSIPAIRGLLRINVTRGRFDIARGYLVRLEEAGLDKNEVLLEEAILESIAGDKKRSKKIIQDIIRDDASNLKAWNMLALIATEQNDRDLQQKCLDQFRKSGKAVPRELLMAMAQVALTQRETTVARRYIDELLYRQPNNEVFLEWRLRIDVYEFNRAEAEKSVERLMAVNPRNGFANYIMGTLHIYREQFALAEPFLQVSVEAGRTVSRLNTLAYVLYERGKIDEAKPLVKEALALDNRHGPAWDTYGMILLKEGEKEEAFKAILRALDFQPKNPEIRFHLARVYALRQEYQKSMDILNDLMLNPTQFSMTTYNEVRRTAESVRAGLKGAVQAE